MLAASVLCTVASAAAADEFRTVPVSAMRVDWRAAVDQLKAEIGAQPAVAAAFSFTPQRRFRGSDPRAWPALLQLNAATSRLFPGISRSPVPVLLPFDTAALLTDRATGAPESLSAAHYQSGFRAADLFEAGAAGYDAVFSLPVAITDGLPARLFAKPVEVQITGSLLTYDINDPLAGKGEPVKALAAQYPDLRRTIREGHVRYAFSRFGVPYVVAIQCLDATPRARRLGCREASPIAERFLKALRIVGGEPSRPRSYLPSQLAERPSLPSPEFSYRPSGEIIEGSGYRGQPGHPDFTVYSQIRFPLAQAPAFANSQSFLNWGDCFHRGRVPPPSGKGASYRCKGSSKSLLFDEAAGENYAYPWQDNFCEARDFGVGQCASGFGHQGQDIRPPACTQRNAGADRCEPNKYKVVAVRDGVLLRAPKQQAATLLINTNNEHIRFRYMHMSPPQMDQDGVLSGRRVDEGEAIGLVSNYQDYFGGTTTHLHFDVQVFTRDGWLWVNPYVTLISAYERLLGQRGREIAPAPPAVAPLAGAVPQDPVDPDAPQEGGGD
ncbi:MAG TPA: peptidoglycan DD-metalloendopeptidase family protein [Rhodopseudomonas sp.]|uniref:peptidoglycan DD-metalloendopeptidase family protein n=1 Tax=Rhodopseudomonas sp. TaxID=1078 RepID=UPI002EDA3E2A